LGSDTDELKEPVAASPGWGTMAGGGLGRVVDPCIVPGKPDAGTGRFQMVGVLDTASLNDPGLGWGAGKQIDWEMRKIYAEKRRTGAMFVGEHEVIGIEE
jgi:hypothetical protein